MAPAQGTPHGGTPGAIQSRRENPQREKRRGMETCSRAGKEKINLQKAREAENMSGPYPGQTEGVHGQRCERQSLVPKTQCGRRDLQMPRKCAQLSMHFALCRGSIDRPTGPALSSWKDS